MSSRTFPVTGPAAPPAPAAAAASPGGGAGKGASPTDFIRAIVTEDVHSGKHGGGVVTRFPPEPNGFLHIGHAKSICLNFGVAREFGGVCHLRFDDTNPLTEDVRYVEAIQQDVRWLGFDWGDKMFFASDYFERLYEYAVRLIRKGKAYVDSLSEAEIREYRGTVTEPGRESQYRDRSVEENLDLFARMRAGEYPDGAHVLRARIDMAHPNMVMRDPVLYRIRHASHYRTGDHWCLYPLYDFTHCLSDAIEGITHSLCTLEFKDNRELYDWVLEAADPPCRPRQIEFARLNVDYTVLSKRRLVELVQGGHVTGWDDPRMPTIAGLRRRGVTPEAIRSFADLVGVAKVDSRVDIEKLEYCIRDDLNRRAPRVMCVLRPLRLVLVDYPADRVEALEAPYFPHDVPREGSRPVPFARELYIERDDFAEHPPRGFHRLAPGREVRLRYAYVVRCVEVVKDPRTGEIVEVRCTHDPATHGGHTPDGRRVRGTIHWVSVAHALPCEVRLYDRLFLKADPDDVEEGKRFTDYLNPDSLVVLRDCRIEPAVAADPPGSRYQFERQGYFCSDPVDSSTENLVFNRTVALRDGWAKVATRAAAAGAPRPERRGAERRAPAATRPARAPVGRRGRRPVPGLSPEQAGVLKAQPALARLFREAIAVHDDPRAVAAWVTNEVVREAGGRPLDALPLTGAGLGALVALVEGGRVTRAAARRVLAEMVTRGGDPVEIVRREKLEQVSDAGVLEPLVRSVVARHPDKAAQYRAGRTGLLGFFVGEVMRATAGTASPATVNQLVERIIAEGATE